MDYKEKYEEALERARHYYLTGKGEPVDFIKMIFPEIEESEDEKIRKELIEFLKLPHSQFVGKRDHEKWIAWLEKQGEQNPADKVEPKFHEGDWVILTAGELSTTLQIVNVDTNKKLYWFNDSSYLPIVDEECLHLWTINDANDGDLIYVSTEIRGIQAIFHKFENGIIYFHCNLCSDFMQGGYEPSGDVTFVSPLQKTHYQKFFQKMKEAGYEWTAEKKKLKKIEVASKEGKDERKELILYLKGIRFTTVEGAEQVRNWITWLEKQET